jgi:hypothetical protein
MVTLQEPGGDEFTVKLRREAVDLDNIQIGDVVNASVIEERVVYLKTDTAALQGTSLKAFGYLETGQDEAEQGIYGYRCLGRERRPAGRPYIGNHTGHGDDYSHRPD